MLIIAPRKPNHHHHEQVLQKDASQSALNFLGRSGITCSGHPKIPPRSLRLTAARSVLDELPAQRPCADRRSALAQSARRPLFGGRFPHQIHRHPDLAEQAYINLSASTRTRRLPTMAIGAIIPRVLDELLSTVLVLCTRLPSEPTDFLLNNLDGSPDLLPTHPILGDVPTRGLLFRGAAPDGALRPLPAARGPAPDGAAAALVRALRGEHGYARALSAAVLPVLADCARAHDASSCWLSRQQQPASALSFRLFAAALDALNPALRYRRLTRDLTPCVPVVLFGIAWLGLDSYDPDFLPLFSLLCRSAVPATLDVLCCLLLLSCGSQLPCSFLGYVLLALFALLFLVTCLVRLGVFLFLPTGDVSGSAAASFSLRPVRSPCRMFWHARLRTMCALRFVLDALHLLPYFVLLQIDVVGGVFLVFLPGSWIWQRLFSVSALPRFPLSTSGLISGCVELFCSVSSTRAQLARSSAADLCSIFRCSVCGSTFPLFPVPFFTCSLHGLLVASIASASGQKGAQRNPKPNPNPKPRAGKTLTLTLSRQTLSGQTLARLGFLSAPALSCAAVAANCGLDGPDWLPTGCRLAAETDLATDCRACPGRAGVIAFTFLFVFILPLIFTLPLAQRWPVRPSAGDAFCDSEAKDVGADEAATAAETAVRHVFLGSLSRLVPLCRERELRRQQRAARVQR